MTIAELDLVTTSAVPPSTSATMRALVYHGPGKFAWEGKPYPAIQDPGDAIVRITTSTIWRNRSSHPEGGSSLRDRRTHSRPRGHWTPRRSPEKGCGGTKDGVLGG